MGRKNRIFKGNLKASQVLAVLMLIVMIIRPIMEVSAKPGEITTENPSAEVGKEGESLSDGIDGSAASLSWISVVRFKAGKQD